jgi:uncharacterized protein
MGGYAQQLPWRFFDYVSMLVLLAAQLPWLLGLFTLGMLAARQGWLTRPERHRHLWRMAGRWGAAALPVAALAAWLNYRLVTRTPPVVDDTVILLGFVGSATILLYLAWVVRYRRAAWLLAAIRWLAPAGRMALTNYLLQSVLMGVLLCGWGLGLGTRLGRAELAVLALAIVLAQLQVSRLWMRRWRQGPFEALWRRVTYAGLSERRS